jgi:hypothetical protein
VATATASNEFAKGVGRGVRQLINGAVFVIGILIAGPSGAGIFISSRLATGLVSGKASANAGTNDNLLCQRAFVLLHSPRTTD